MIDPKYDIFIVLREKFTFLFHGETSNKEDLKYKLCRNTTFSMFSIPIYIISIF